MGLCKKDVTPLLLHWSYVFLVLTDWNWVHIINVIKREQIHQYHWYQLIPYTISIVGGGSDGLVAINVCLQDISSNHDDTGQSAHFRGVSTKYRADSRLAPSQWETSLQSIGLVQTWNQPCHTTNIGDMVRTTLNQHFTPFAQNVLMC